MNQMKEQINTDSNELREITPQINELQQQLKEVDEQIMQVGGNDYKAKKDLVEQLGQKLSQVERMLTRYKTTLQSSESNVKKFELEIEKNE